MAFDFRQVIEAAARAAIEDPGSDARERKSSGRKPRRLSGARGFLIGAGVVTAGRLILSARSGELLEKLQQRLAEYEEQHFGEYELDDPEAVDEEEDEPDEDAPEDDEDAYEDDEDEEEDEERPRAASASRDA